MHYAASNNRAHCIANLVGEDSNLINATCNNNGADNTMISDGINYGGWTSLHFAAMKGNTESVQKLLELGADIHVLNEDGKTALDLAQERDHTNIVEMLQQHENKQMSK